MTRPSRKFVPHRENLVLEERAATPAIPATEIKITIATIAETFRQKRSDDRETVASVASVATVAGHLPKNAKLHETLAFENTELIQVCGVPTFLPFDDWIEFEERAAILEFDGGYSREEAERLALVELGFTTNGDIYDKNF